MTVERWYAHGIFTDPLPGYDDAVAACFRAIPRADRPGRLYRQVRIERPPIEMTSRRPFAHAPYEYEPYTTDLRFTACVAAVLPTVDELRRFDVDDRPGQPGAGHGFAVEFVAEAYSHAAAEQNVGKILYGAP